VRVVAGELGGRRLLAPRSGSVRPTTDRVREALFSILGDLGGARALDLFCGTGALGIEALSRGARSATFVDTDTDPVERNVTALGLEARSRVHRGDALRFLERDGDRYDLVLCDPPYRVAPRLGPELDTLLDDRLAAGARVIVEGDPGAPPELGLELDDERRYGSTLIRIYSARRR